MEEAFDSNDKKEVLRLLVEPSSPSVDLECEDALHRACENGWLDVAGVIISKYKVSPDVADFWGSRLRPIHLAARNGQTEAIDFLLVAGGDREAKDTYGNTALHFAFQNKQWETAEYLIAKAKSDLGKKNYNGITPLTVGFEGAVSLDSPEVMKKVIGLYSESKAPAITVPYWILEQVWAKGWKDELVQLVNTETSKSVPGSYNPIPVTVAGEGNMEFFEFLLQQVEADESAVDVNGNNTLMTALHNGHVEVAKRIIERAPNLVAVKNVKGESPVRFAVRSDACDIEIVKLLVKNGANPDEPDQNGNTPLVSALRGKNMAMVEYLVREVKCDLGFKNKTGGTPLSGDLVSALYEKNTDWLMWLLSLTLETNERNRAITLIPKNALHLACQNRLVPVIEMLIQKYNCDPLQPNVALGGQTVLHKVFERKDVEIASILLAHKKCNPNYCVNDGMTPIEHAEDNTDLLMLLECGNNPFVCQARKPVKVFVLGTTSTGKTSLVNVIRSFENRQPFLGSLCRVQRPRMSTAGISSFKLHHKDLGSIILYDCAGNPQYHPGLAAILERQVESSPAVFVVVVDVDQKKEGITKELMYWTYLLNCVTGNSPGQSHVIIVGNKADHSSMNSWDFQNCCTLWINSDINGLVSSGAVMLDCHKLWSHGLTDLVSILSQSCATIRSDSPFKLQFEHLSLYAFCMDQMPNSFRVSELKVALDSVENSSTLPQGDGALLASLNLLHKKGLLVFLESEEGIAGSCVVTELDLILHQVFGRLFAPSDSHEYLPLNVNTGMVPLSHLEQLSREPQVALLFLQHFSLALNIPQMQSFFIPGLIGIKELRLNDLMSCNDGHWFGWLSEFKEEHSHLHFISFFLHMVQMKVVDTFVKQHIKKNDPVSLDVSSPRMSTYHIWKNGIHWIDENQIECLIEVSEEKRALLLLIACPKGKEIQSTLCRFQVLEIMKNLETRFFKVNSHHLTDSLVANSELLWYPNLSLKDVSKCPLQDMYTAVLTGRESVGFASASKHNPSQDTISLRELLFFDSYVCIPHEVLVEVLKLIAVESEKTVPDHVMMKVASMISRMGEPEILEVCGLTLDEISQFHPKQTENREALSSKLLQKWKANQLTLRQLKTILDRFTIFVRMDLMFMAHLHSTDAKIESAPTNNRI